MTAERVLDTVTRLFAGYAEGDTETVRGLLANDLTAEVEAERVRRLWMVDALPAYSDEFWS